MTDLSGQYLGRYYLTERLGEGGMATVYKAYDTRLERDVAVKIIRSAAFSEEAFDQVLKRFEREAKSLAKLSHPNIVKVHDYGEHDGSPYLVMEYLPGGTLKKMLGKPVLWQEAVRLILPVARGIAYAHQRGILHRDIKPANILITESGEPMLSDFGIAKLFEADQTTALTGSGMAIGTPEYMAPEQWTGTTSPQSDLYSLGIVLYEMVAGRKPYVADTPAAILIKQATEPLPSPRKFFVDVPEALELVLVKTLAKEPGDRYKDLNAFITALERLQTGAPVIHAEDRPVEKTYQVPVKEHAVLAEADSQTIHVTEAFQPQKAEEPLVPAETAKAQPPKRFSVKTMIWLIAGIGVLLVIGLCSTLIGKWIAPASVETATVTSISQLIAPSITVEPSQQPFELGTPTVASLENEITDVKSVEMLLVPAGEFTMGNNNGEPDESPAHPVHLNAYYLDKYEVTNELYKTCVDSGICLPPVENGSYTRLRYFGNPEFDNYPVVYTTWNMARTFCEWRGARLPTEAEWEKALRGEGGGVSVDGTHGNAVNFCDRNCPFNWADQNYDDGYPDTAPKDAYPEADSPYGFYNLSGNVWEWIQDWYGAEYYQDSPGANPSGPASGTYRVIRGGSYGDILDYTRVTRRSKFDPAKTTSTLGFRCALPADLTSSQPTPTLIPKLPSGFVVSYNSDVNGNRDIFLLNPSTGESQGIITDPSHDKVGTWSPDGRLLAFESNRNSGAYYQIYLYDSDQGTTTRLTDLAECSNWAPSWSPDGKKIVFYSNCEDEQREIFVMNRDGSGRKKLTSNTGEDKFPAFSPNGATITFTSTRNGLNQIYLMNADGSDQRLVVDGCSSTFSPDGEWLWFSTTCEDSDIKRVRINGTNLSVIGEMLGHNPSVSPDGLYVVFESNSNIWIMWVDGSKLSQVTTGSAVDGAPSWKPK